jgi:hypothetical protein
MADSEVDAADRPATTADRPATTADRPATTLEWGGVDEHRARWWDRVIGRAGEPGRALAPAGVGVAVVGFALVLAAQVLPWMDLTATSAAEAARQQTGRTTLGLDQLGTWALFAYQVGWMLLLATVCVALVVEPAPRRIVGAAGIGFAAAQLAVVVGLTSTVQDGGGVFRLSDADAAGVGLGEGVYCAYAAVLLLSAAILLAGRRPGRRVAAAQPRSGRYRRIVADDEETAGGPIDLTVTPLPAAGSDGRGRYQVSGRDAAG